MRNIKKEYEWKKNKYVRVLADVDKELGEEFKEKIKNDTKYQSISEWLTEQIKKYLKKS